MLLNRRKVCDFGLSAVKENETEKLQDTDSVPGTPLWMAPEVLMGKPFDASSDVYSFGIVLWEMLTKEEVYPEFTSFGAFKRAICYKHHRPTIPANTEPSLAALMEACWHREAAQRPSFQQIIKSLELIMVDVAVHGDDCFVWRSFPLFKKKKKKKKKKKQTLSAENFGGLNFLEESACLGIVLRKPSVSFTFVPVFFFFFLTCSFKKQKTNKQTNRHFSFDAS